ncbi:MAG: 30S ribosomal protein S6 [Candidatus Saccharibacteria bacterium]|nr:30S ribosomal protein S6 [Candidatus Saccharibacteria bacterium]
MKQYELTVLYHPDLEMNITPATDKIAALVKANGGKIVSEENEGKKRLAYPINGLDYAVYYFYVVELPAEAPRKIEATLNISEETIRHLLVSVDARKAKYAAKRAEREDKEDVAEDNE